MRKILRWVGYTFLGLICFHLIASAYVATVVTNAEAQGNTTCATRPTTDNSNACATTAWVHNFVAAAGNIPGTSVTFIQAGLGAIQRTMQDKARERISVLDFGAACDGSTTTDDRAAIQLAINATPTGGRLVFPSANACGVGKNPSAGYGLVTTQPIIFDCTGGGGIIPLASLGTANDVIYNLGSAAGNYEQTGVDGCFIGDRNLATRFGRFALVFDTQAVGGVFVSPFVRNSYIQQNISVPTGSAIFAINSASNNPTGGLHNATLCENSTLYGGISLNSVGDSIILKNCLSTGAGQVYVNLINSGGGKAGNFVIDGGPISNAGGLVIDCAASVQIVNVEGEQNTTSTGINNALYDLNGGICGVENVTINGGQLQADASIGSPTLVRIANATNTSIDNMRIATPTAYAPIVITAAASNTTLGAGNSFSGGGTITDSGTNTRRTISIPLASGGAAQYIKCGTAGGACAPAQPTIGELGVINANTIVGNPTGSPANPVATAAPNISTLTLAAVAPTVGAGQIGYGATVVAPGSGNCPTGTVGTKTVAGCIVLNVAGSTAVVPYF